MGIFEGHYLTDCTEEFPAEWFKKAKLNPNRPDITLNCFGVKSRLDRSDWIQRGWILPPDPRGWFQWYCRYWLGRRISGLDELQITRWKSFKRHLAQVEKIVSRQTCLAVQGRGKPFSNGPIIRLFNYKYGLITLCTRSATISYPAALGCIWSALYLFW